jgi:hypothetical protein
MTASALVALLLAAPATQAAPGTTPPAPGAAPVRAVEPGAAPAAPARPTVLAGEADARRVCEALAPPDRLRPGGTALERADVQDRHAAAREGALAGRYQVSVPGDRLRFGAWSAEEGELALYRHAAPVGAAGAVRLHLVEDPRLPVAADAATVRRILAAQAEKKLALEVTFVLPEEEEAPCFHVAGSGAYTVAAEPVAWSYVADGQVLARGGQGADRPLVSAKAGARPRVQLGAPLEEGGAGALAGALEGRVRDLEGCYAAALERDPFLDGALVADLATGREERVRIAADSVGSDDLAGCVRGALAKVDVRGKGRAFLPIHFVLDPPGAGGAGGQ